MPIIEHDGLTVDLIDEGSGPPVVLAHSSVSGNRQWRRLIESLRGRYRVLAPNLFGYGQTTPWTRDGEQTLGDAARVLLAACSRSDEPVRLVGHSWGGAVALKAASLLGGRVARVVVYEPMLPSLLRIAGRDAAWAEAHALLSDVKRLGAANDWERLAARFTDYFNGDGSWDRTPVERRGAVVGALRPNYFEWDAATHADPGIDVRAIAAPTLLVRGGATRRVMHEVVDVLLERSEGWMLREIEGAGHMAPLAQADAFNAIVAGFLDAAPRRAIGEGAGDYSG